MGHKVSFKFPFKVFQVWEKREESNALSTRTSILPNIPLPTLNPLRLPLLPNLRTRHTLIIPVIPLPYVICNLHIGIRPYVIVCPLFLPGQFVAAAER